MCKEPPYLEPLNPEQRRAVLHTGKPLLILAGAGSGKTRVITTKIAWLIREQGLDPRSILAVTFTNKAAREMAERAKLIEPMAGNAMLRTFHSFGAWFLRRNGSHINLDSSFVIYDDADVISLLSSLFNDLPRAELKRIAYNISRAKDYFLSPDDPGLALIDHRKRFRDWYAHYEERLAQIGNVDFGDLIKKPAEILRSQPEIAARFYSRFKVIMVDEYQDANVAQFHLLKELCGPETYVCVVGDDDQSIYKFRGAEVKNILEFPQKFEGADVIRLESNYRSTSPILSAASSVVDNNRGRLGKNLRSEKGNGGLPILAYLSNQDEEAMFCAKKIKSHTEKKETAWMDWAVLYRTNAQSLCFETEFLRRGIPYRVVGSLKFYEREEIKDALAFLALLVNPRDEIAFRRVVNKPARGIGAITTDRIADLSFSYNGNLLEACKDALSEKCDFSAKAQKGLDDFLKIIENAKKLLENSGTEHKNHEEKKQRKKKGEITASEGLSVCIAQIVKDSGLEEYHKTKDEISGNSKIGNLQELLNTASKYRQNIEGLVDFLQDIELDRSMEDSSDNPDSKNTVTLITLHNTKGLEFKRVIMTGLENGIFPREDKKDDELEEERRLFYVGATRAMDELYFTSCAERRMYGRTMPAQPSIFLNEIDKSCLQIIEFRKPAVMRSFNAYNFNYNYNAEAQKIKKQKLEEQAGYKIGDRVSHEHFGHGGIVKIKSSNEGPVVYVRFDNGRETFFNSDSLSHKFEKLGEDY